MVLEQKKMDVYGGQDIMGYLCPKCGSPLLNASRGWNYEEMGFCCSKFSCKYEIYLPSPKIYDLIANELKIPFRCWDKLTDKWIEKK